MGDFLCILYYKSIILLLFSNYSKNLKISQESDLICFKRKVFKGFNGFQSPKKHAFTHELRIPYYEPESQIFQTIRLSKQHKLKF
jgi:hypothetical protein